MDGHVIEELSESCSEEEDGFEMDKEVNEISKKKINVLALATQKESTDNKYCVIQSAIT